MEELKFEQKMKKLEEYIGKLENNDTPLDESIHTYTEAMKLVKSCDQELHQYEEQVTKLIDENGQEHDFEIEE